METSTRVGFFRMRTLLIGLSVLCALGALGGAAHALFGLPSEDVSARSATGPDSEAVALAELRRRLDDGERRRQGLERELAGHTHEPPAPAATAPASPAVTKPGRGTRPPRHPGVKPATPCAGDSHDPLNPCLGG